MKKPLLSAAFLAALAIPASAATTFIDLGNVGSSYQTVSLGSSVTTTDGITLSVAKTSITGGGSGSQNAIFTGDASAVASPFTNAEANLLNDGIYINNSAEVTFTFTGLDSSSVYNIAAFGGLTTDGASTPSNFTLTVGSSDSAATQSIDVDAATGGVASWSAITADNGTIAFTVTANGGYSGYRTEVNAISVEATPVPEASASVLLGLAGLSLLLRRRR